MTTVEKIKAKILDLAIRGKLVPQDPNDEPASVLLERIKAEKAKLVKAKKIKKDKNPSEIVVGADGATYEKFADGTSKDISDELPFDLPQGWAWARLKNIAYVATGKTPSKDAFVDRGIPYIKMYNLRRQALDFDFHPQFITREVHNTSLSRSRLAPHDLLMNIVGPPLGKLAIVPESIQEGNFNQAAVMIRPYFEKVVINKYLYYYLWQMDEINFLDTKGTAGQDNISLTQVQHMRIAVPPLAEQKRIIAKIKELFAYADAIGEASDRIAKIAERVDKKIFDLAIRGQLVPQDPDDEPARELVKRIDATKNAKSTGKRRRAAASDRPAYEIEPPFEIPDSWEWVKLKDLGVFVGGHTPSLADPSNWENGTVLWVTSKDMKQKYIEDTGCKVSAKGASELHLLPSGSLIMVTRSGILRRTFPVALAAKPLTINQDQRALQFYDNAIGEYVYCCIRSFESTILRDYRKTGTTVESIIWGKFIGLPIPLPPLAEQKRIVAKVDELKRMTRTLVAS